MELGALRPDPVLLAAGVVLDLLLGDPVYRWHPVRLVGHSVAGMEKALRRLRLDGCVGGAILGLSLAAGWAVVASAAILVLQRASPALSMAAHVLILYWMLALRCLLDYVWAVERASRSRDVDSARQATAQFVGRDTATLDIPACRRASIESLGENLTDGYVSPLFWYAVAGVPGLVVFKVFSTLDSMVGNKSERYLRFGWFSARTDDVLNWIPARLTWLLIAFVALFLPGCSAARALVVGWRQHAVVPGPNSGWSEAATAGAIRRRLAGPIFAQGRKVTDTWLGDAQASPAGERARDVPMAMALNAAAGLLAAGIAMALLATVR